jgi:hypothetical protein
MAVRNIAVTDTIEKFRTEFNAMTLNDFGDIANLDASLTATNLVDAMNETLSVATNTAGFRIEDSSSTQQLIGGGEVMRILGTSNEIEAVVSATDTLTIGLPNAVSITTSVTAPTVVAGNLSLTNGSITDSGGSISFGDENLSTTGTINAGNITGANITGTGTTHTLGTIEIAGNVIRSTDSTSISINDSVSITGNLSVPSTNEITFGSLLKIDTQSSLPTITSTGAGAVLLVDAVPLLLDNTIRFEGSSIDTNDTTLTATNPTADRTISLPDLSGNVVLDTSTGYATSTIFNTSSTLILYNSSGTPVKTIVGSST